VKQRVEGFGIVYLEAAMRGKPSIGSRHGGIPEVVLDGETGFLVNPADAHELREKILLLKEGKGLRETMGKKAEERARALFSPRTIAGIFVQISQDGWRAGLREERMT
jgi:glycosyltransferase involved in cell wall biosynthesis